VRSLEPAMTWLFDHRPTTEQRRVICHGDFHPQNILMAHGTVTGVIDWPIATVAEPAFDVASTRVILESVPLELLGIPPAFRVVLPASPATSEGIGVGGRLMARGWPITKRWPA